MKIQKQKCFHIIISMLIGIAISLGLAYYEKKIFLEQGITLSAQRLLCDGFFISSVIFLSIGGLSFIAANGGYDALNYAFIKFIDRIRTPRIEERDKDSYYEYVTKKHKDRKPRFLHFLVLGFIFLLISLIFLALLTF